jgi:Domain of unknown function (DUF4412)
MKKFLTRCLFLSLSILLTAAGTSRAQFLKQILNSVSGTAQNRANEKANQTTNKALDKVDSATRISPSTQTSNKTPVDTSSTNSVLGAFAKAAAANPNDTSAADLTMKALAMLAGGGGVSPQDSVAAINSFKTSNGGSGMHYEYSITTSGKKIATNKDTMLIYFTNAGEGRVDMSIPMPGVKMNRMISIGHLNQPKFTILLYPESKTYSLNIIDTSMMKSGESYQVTKLGTETVQGFSCTHSRITSTTGSGAFKSTMEMEIWTSTEVPGYALYKKMTSLRPSQMRMYTTLENAGCGGLFVKMVVTGNDSYMEQLLIKSGESNLSADLFRVPSGYNESSGNMFSHMMSPATK